MSWLKLETKYSESKFNSQLNCSNEAYRLNLETGRFMAPLVTEGSSLTSCDISPEHFLLLIGTAEVHSKFHHQFNLKLYFFLQGKLEAWDPRSRKRVAVSDCALSLSSFSDK